MAKSALGSNGENFARQLLVSQFEAYRKVAVRKHGISPDLLHREASDMSNEELSAAISVLRDLAHLPAE